MTAPFSAALIAGGKSSRMGCDKKLIEIDGVPLWKRQIALLRELKPAEILISGRPDRLWGTGLRVIEDAPGENNVLGALKALLSAAACERVVVLGVDLPKMGSEYLRDLLRLADGCGIVPRRNGRYEPVAAVYPQTCAGIAAALLRAGEFKLQSFVQTAIDARLVRSVEVESAHLPFFFNLNTPADLLALTSNE